MILVAAIFIVLGILIKHARMYFLIAGYNTMSKEDKAKYKIKELATFFRNVMFGMAFINILGYFIETWLGFEKAGIYSLFISMAIGIPYLLIVSNSKRFKV